MNSNMRRRLKTQTGFTPTPISDNSSSGVVTEHDQWHVCVIKRSGAEIGVSSRGERGFTLIESLIAIVILMTVIAAMYTFVVRGLQSTFFASDQSIATFLARDGLEYVRHIRNSNELAGNSWLSGLSECESTNGCILDTPVLDPWSDSSAIQTCSGSGCEALSYNQNTGEYGYGSGSSWIQTQFIRTVNIDILDASVGAEDIAAKITSAVTWEEEGVVRQVELIKYLYDW